MNIDIDKLKKNSIPLVGACSGVYFLFSDDELVYVGQGWNCLLRVAEHTRKESDKIFNKWNFIQIDDEKERKELEFQLRKQLKPKYNKV
jgi:excinuclease UvrABC nuclease subunit